ncbi:MAG: hypothetical protein ACR2PG_04410 [Hyphomicrobiaceae bacterium]
MKTVLTTLLFALTLSCGALADTIERDYQAVMHITEAHTIEVFDDSKHVVGVGKFRGLAVFANGEVAKHRYEGWFDLTNGEGKFHGYALWQFEDGSELRADYDGAAVGARPSGISFKASFKTFVGTGRYTGAKVSGSYEGRRVEPVDKGGLTYLTGRLVIKKSPN